MRDGAEMDLDLDVTQRMIENDSNDVSNMDEVIKTLESTCGMLDDENKLLDDEVKF